MNKIYTNKIIGHLNINLAVSNKHFYYPSDNKKLAKLVQNLENYTSSITTNSQCDRWKRP